MEPADWQRARKALVSYGSETGNAQEVAQELGRLLERQRFAVRVMEMDQLSSHDLVLYSIVVFAISTTGQGDLPRNSQRFWKKLRSKRLHADSLSSVVFASFGLGDSSYPNFNWAHRKLYNRVMQLGAHLLCERGESDEQHPEGIEGCVLPWLEKLKSALAEKFPLPPGVAPIAADEFLVPKWAIKTTTEASKDSVRASNIRRGETVTEQPNTNDLDLNSTFAATKVDQKSAGLDGMFNATLVRNERLTPLEHWQDVRIFEFKCTAFDYSPGDVLTVFPKNSKPEVDSFLALMGWDKYSDSLITFEPTSEQDSTGYYPPSPLAGSASSRKLTLRDLLTDHLDIMAIPRRSFFASMIHFTNDETQRERLQEFTDPQYVDELYDYTSRPRRSILEVLQEFDTVKIPFKWAASVLPHIRGRQFSIASGGNLKYNEDGSGRIELLVAIVKYRTVIKKIREGLCTKYLASLSPGTRLDVQLCKGGMKHSIQQPAVMIGPGTGVAPLRSMLLERVALGVTEKSLLFFGGRNKSADYFFEDEWDDMKARLNLDIFSAFSRDQKHKIYVQDVIRQQAQQVYEALESGAVYICGSSGKMPQAVREALTDVFEKEGPMMRPDAELRLEKMEKNGMYQQETW